MAPSTTPRAKATPKAKASTTGGVKKGGPGRKAKGMKKNSQAMAAMQTYFKEHRSEFSSLSFKDQQKELGKMWKAAPENPKNSS